MAPFLLPCYGVGLKPFSPLPKPGSANGPSAQLGHPLALRSSGQRRRKERSWVALAAVCRAAPVVLRDLDADDFWHPFGKLNTLLLRAIPGLNELGKALLGPVSEQVMLLKNIGTSVLVAENQVRRYVQQKLYN